MHGHSAAYAAAPRAADSMPIIPNLAERTLVRLNQLPGALSDLLGAAVFRAVGTAQQLGVFEALADEALAVEALATRLGCSTEGLAHLLDLLAAAGYVRKRGERFHNTAQTTRWMLRRSPRSVGDFLTLWQAVTFDLWDGLEASLRAGRPAVHMHEWLSRRPDGWATFNAVMRSAATLGADEIAERAELPPAARRLLDVGGSHGLFSVGFCNRYPELSATIFDLPEALESARRTIAERGMAGRIDTRAGDMTAHEFGADWDVILLFNVMHYFDVAQNRALLHKASAALRPGGSLLILEQLADRAPLPAAAAFVKALSLLYFSALGGRVYRSDEIADWLREAGCAAPRRVSLRRVPGTHLLISRRTR